VSSASSSWWSRLLNGGAQSDLAQRLERMEQQLADLGRQVAALRGVIAPEAGSDGANIASLQEALLSLEKQVGRAGREQLKTNTVAEAQSAQLADALEQLRAADSRRAAELDALREQHRREQVAARRAAAQDILPALDSLDEALRSGRQLLATSAQHAADTNASASAPPASGGWLRQLFGEPQPARATPQHAAAVQQLAEQTIAIDAWVTGLTFVRKRLLDILAAADVRPIDALGQPFDPEQHVAIGVVPPSEHAAAGTVVEELRRGYVAGERVLRHAEVLVAAIGEQQAEQRLEDQKER
jgi:molecular chaperone GrpE (heat shock protein)